MTWTPGSLTGSFDIDSSNPGNDVTVTISGNTSRFFSSSYPQVTDDFSGGISPLPDQLDLYVNFANTSESITVTVTFHYVGGVSDVNFTLFDVDTGSVTGTTKGKDPVDIRGFVDQVRAITAIATNNTLVAPTISVSNTTYTQLSGSGTNQAVTGQNVAGDFTSQGSVNVSFGTNTISSFTFTYGQGPNSETDPFAQGIGLYDINYKPKVPEFHPGLIAGAFCLLIAAFRIPRWFA
ncbi:MAG TPA: hypothetical protein VGH19_12265 [Verrucomicrobiae bacterium]